MILVGTISSAQAVRREEIPKPDMDISQLGEVVLMGGGTTTTDISQLSSVVLYETEDIIRLSDIKHISSPPMVGASAGNTTNISVNQPDLSGVEVDQSILLMTIMHRSVVTPPPGWTLVHEQSVDTANQMTAVYKKDVLSAEDGGVSSVWAQSVSARFIGQAHLFTSGVQGKKVTIDSAAGITGANPIAVSPLTSSEEGEVALSVASFYSARTSGSTTIDPPSGFAPLSPISTANHRLSAAYKRMIKAETLSGSFQSSADVGTGPASSVTLKLKLVEV